MVSGGSRGAGQSVTDLLARMRAGQGDAGEELWTRLYRELYRLAWSYLGPRHPGELLPATALVNEAYIRLVSSPPKHYNDRKHFFAVCSRVMRSILVDEARRRRSSKRDSPGSRVPLDRLIDAYESNSCDLMDLDQGLSKLEELDSQAAQIVDLRFFGGRSMAEIAELLDVPLRTVERDWSSARTWLYRKLS